MSDDELSAELARFDAMFEQLNETLGMDMRYELLNLFFPTLEECVNGMEGEIEAGNPDAVARHAHKLKGCAGQLGGEYLSGLAREIETWGRDGQLDPVRAAFPRLKSFAGALAAALKAKMQE
jgi:HPt (histidine-containing phosphotransfer) domain-containing protein